MRTKALWTLMLAPALVAAGCGGSGGGGGSGTKTLSEEQVISNARPSVVEITDKVGQNVQGGTGVVVNAQEGLVLTNAHVVSGASALKARVLDKTDVPAQIVAQAPCDDLAIVRLTTIPPGLKAIGLGDSKAVKAGQNVTVLGYPETLDQSGGESKLTATTGTVSQPDTSAALGAGSPKYPSLIQHQAPVNHGNSGGPLVDATGKMIGINTLTAAGAGSGQIQGQYYSITVDHAKDLLGRLEAGKSVANLGWNLAPIDQQLLKDDFGPKLGRLVASYLVAQHDTNGLVVRGTDPGSPAGKAHFASGDYITQINGTPIKSVQDVCDVAQSAASGSTIHIDGRYLASAAASNKQIGESYTQNLKVP